MMQILKTAYDKAVELLSENRECLDKIADFLIEKETITGKEFMRIFREVKGIPEPEEKDSAPAAENSEKKAEVSEDVVKAAESSEDTAKAENTEKENPFPIQEKDE